ncbi:hypothetical protein N9N66_02655 [Schleiferiaceae bacterium]|nr:hypothetical protein [Schleiferiaceae bacterium]
MTKNTFFFAFMLLFAGVASAQEIRISGHQVVASDSTWTVNAGTTVVFGPNASVEVLGGLEFQGTVDMPIRITSLDPYEGTGLGFLINGQSNTYINLNNIIVNNLQTPFRFDPFWYRSRVTLSNVQFYENNQEFKRNAPIVSVGVPFLRLEQPATLNLTGLYFANNYGGVVIDGLGQNGANYFLNGLAFEYNEGYDQYNTPLHLELSGNATNYTVSNLLFNQNENYGLSVGGIDGAINIENIYLNTRESVSNIIDKNTNYRLPLVEGDRLDLASNPTAPGFVTQALFLDQEPGTVIVERAQGATSVPTMLFDADGSAIEFTSIETDRGLELSYAQGLPFSAVFGNGTFAYVKPLAVEELPEPLYDFTKKGMGSGFSDMLEETGIADWTSKKMDQLLHPKNKPGFEESWEAGGTFGGTLYDGRDLKMARFSTQDILEGLPNIGMLWPGGAIGYTGGAFIQYNRNSYVSYKASINALNVNAGKIRSLPYRFTDSRLTQYTISQFGTLTKKTHRFSTSIQTAELSTIRHFTANQLSEGKKAKWVPGWTAGIGVLHFTPYAVENVRTTDESIKWYLFTTRDIKRNLRKAGTAGQNNILGMSQYGQIAALASTGFTLSYLRPTWRFTGEIKGNITTTDYLDDYGRGTYFGGDYITWQESTPEYTYTDPLSGELSDFNLNSFTGGSGAIGSRAQNYMPDGFWQIQLSFSKDLDSEKIVKYYEPLILNNLTKVNSWWIARRGEKHEANTWEIGSSVGASFYDGRDLKYKKILGLAPLPTNVELSQGVYVQKNSHQRYSWNLGIHAANMSYGRTQTPLQLAAGRNIVSYNNDPNTPTVRIEPRSFNFFTKTSSIESNIYYHFRDYELPEGKKFWFVPSFGLGLGVMNYTPYREVRGLDVGVPAFFRWKRARSHYVDLREVGSEGQHILPNGRAYGKWAGLYNASFQLSMHTSKWIYKAEIKSNMTTTDYLDDFGRGAWYGGNYSMWGDALDVSYFNTITGEEIPLTADQVSDIPSDFNLFTPRATNNIMDGYLQFHIGLSRRL